MCLAAAACSNSCTPTQPTNAAAAAGGAAATSSVTVPRQVSPAAGASIRNVDQPVTLVVANAVLTQSAAATYTFEVSTDANFGTKAYSKSGVTAGSGGQTSLTIDKIAAGTSYFWRARAEGGGTTGPFSAARAFTIGPAIVIDAATLVSPIGSAGTGARPTFTVDQRDPLGAGRRADLQVRDRHHVQLLSPVLITGTVSEGAARTSFTPVDRLAGGDDAVLARDGQRRGERRQRSDHAGWNVRDLVCNRLEEGRVPEQPQRLGLATDGGAVAGGAGRRRVWSGVYELYRSGLARFAMAVRRRAIRTSACTPTSGTSRASAARGMAAPGEWIYRGASSCKAGQGTHTIGPDSGFGPPFSTWVPQVGELVGFMVSSVARNGPVKRTVDERSNVIVQPWRDTTLGSRSMDGFSEAHRRHATRARSRGLILTTARGERADAGRRGSGSRLRARRLPTRLSATSRASRSAPRLASPCGRICRSSARSATSVTSPPRNSAPRHRPSPARSASCSREPSPIR